MIQSIEETDDATAFLVEHCRFWRVWLDPAVSSCAGGVPYESSGGGISTGAYSFAPLALEYGCTVVSAESQLVRDALARYKTRALAAKHLGITQSTVTRRAKQYSLESRAS